MTHPTGTAGPAALLLTALAWLMFPSFAAADGGTLRWQGPAGPDRLAVFTSPTPFRAGPVDVSVMVQEAATGMPRPARVFVRIRNGDVVLEGLATAEAATNKLFQACQFDLPGEGLWEVTVEVDGQPAASFPLPAEGPLPRWQAFGLWIGWPVGAVLVFAVHQWLVRRQARRAVP